jgi:hypothetical protein
MQTFPMVAWMRRRRTHGWRQCWEMTGAMCVPVLGVLGCYWAGRLSADSVCPLSCVLMFPAMAAAMLFRLGTYATQHVDAA